MNTHFALKIDGDNSVEMIASGPEAFCRERGKKWVEKYPLPEYAEIIIVERSEKESQIVELKQWWKYQGRYWMGRRVERMIRTFVRVLPKRLRYWVFVVEGSKHCGGSDHPQEVVPEVTFLTVLGRVGDAAGKR